MQAFFDMADVPVLCNAPCPTREAALRYPTGDIKLAFCRRCGFVVNLAHRSDAVIYDQNYENSLHFSPRFQEYIQELATHLINRFELHDKDIIEIGCGKGDFLALLSDLGGNCGVGFDPTYEDGRVETVRNGRLRIIRDFYSESYGELPCDFLCCRHTLEHVPSPVGVLRAIRRAIGERLDTAVFFEVPNVLYTLRHRGIWDIIYEHCSYFWSFPLSRLFAECGFRVCDVREAYDGQFLCIEAMPSASPHIVSLEGKVDELDRVLGEVQAFGGTFRAAVERARQVLDRVKARKQRAVVWGGGSKGVTFLNIFKDCEVLEYVVDINPHKQGKYVPGTGQQIVAPESLPDLRPDVVFVMNPIYRNEIGRTISDLGVTADLVVL